MEKRTREERIKNIRLKISSEIQKYQDISISLSQPAQFLRFPDENIINLHIADIMYDSAMILNQMTFKKLDFTSRDLPPEAVSLLNLDKPIQELKEQVEELSFDVENQLIQFGESETTAHQIFSDQVISIQKDYQAKIAKLVIENSNEEEQLEKRLEDLHEKFDHQLEKEFSAQIAERDEIRRQLISLKQKYEDASNILNSQTMQSTAAQKSTSQTSFSPSPPTSTTASVTSNGDDNPCQIEVKRHGRAKGMTIEKSMPTITCDRSLNSDNNNNNNNNSDGYNENRLASGSLYYENTTEENSASLPNEPQIEEEEEYDISGESYENSNGPENFAVSVNSADIDNGSEKTDIVYYSKRAEAAKSEKQRLNDELYRLQNFYSREKNRLHESIIKAKNATDTTVKRHLEKQESNYIRKRRQFDELFKQRKKDLNGKIASVEEAKIASANRIQNEINSKKRALRELDESANARIAAISKQTNDSLKKLEDEIVRLKSDQTDRKNFKVRPPPSPQSQIQPPSSSPSSPSSGNLQEGSFETRRTESQLSLRNSDLRSNYESFRRASKKEIEAADRATKAAVDQYNIEKQLMQCEIDAEKAVFEEVERNKEIVSLKIGYLNEIKKNLIDKFQTEDQQRDEIRSLDEELEKIKNNRPEKVELQVVQDEMLKEKNEWLNRFDLAKVKLDSLEAELNEKFEELMADEKNRRNKRLKSLIAAKAEAEDDLKSAKKYLSNCQNDDKDENSKNTNSNKKEIHMPEGSAASVKRIQMESKCISSLPLLKH